VNKEQRNEFVKKQNEAFKKLSKNKGTFKPPPLPPRFWTDPQYAQFRL
jgi:hypothetical protein